MIQAFGLQTEVSTTLLELTEAVDSKKGPLLRESDNRQRATFFVSAEASA